MNDNSNKKLNVELLIDSSKRLKNIPDSDYFGAKFKGYVSNSSLKLINPEEGGSATKFLSGFSEKKTSNSLDTGTAVHQLLLESDKYVIADVSRPSGKIGEIADELYKLKSSDLTFKETFDLALKNVNYYNGRNVSDTRKNKIKEDIHEYYEYLSKRETEEVQGICLKQGKDANKVQGCVASIKNHEKARELLFPKKEGNLFSYNEDVITMHASVKLPMDNDLNEPIVKIKLKCKVDNWSIDFDTKTITLNDLKTTGYPVDQFKGLATSKISLDGTTYESFTNGSFQKYHYYRQMSMYKQMLFSFLKREYPKDIDDTWMFNVHMIVVDTNEPYTTSVFKVSDKWLDVGDFEFKVLLNKVAYHLQYGFQNSMEINCNEINVI